MEITYLNHSSFLLKAKVNGDIVKILFNPFSKVSGFKFKKTEADIVLLSTTESYLALKNVVGLENYDVSDESFEISKNKPFVIKDSGEFEVRGVHIKGIASENNIIFVIQAENYVICHLGHLKDLLNDTQIEQIGEVDLLLVPTGGVTTLNPESAFEVVNQIEPGFVIPMNFKNEKYSISDFLKVSGNDNVISQESFTVQKQSGEEVEVIILAPKYI